MNLHKKVLKLCHECKVSLNFVEKVCGFGKNTLCKWGTHEPSIGKVKKVADFFGMSIQELIEMDEGEEN